MNFPLDWEAGYRSALNCSGTEPHVLCRYTQEAPEVVVQLLLGRRAELTEVMDTEEVERRMVEEMNNSVHST